MSSDNSNAPVLDAERCDCCIASLMYDSLLHSRRTIDLLTDALGRVTCPEIEVAPTPYNSKVITSEDIIDVANRNPNIRRDFDAK